MVLNANATYNHTSNLSAAPLMNRASHNLARVNTLDDESSKCNRNFFPMKCVQ